MIEVKKYVLLAALIVTGLFLSKYMPEEPEKVKSKPVLRIGSECDYVPNSWEEINRSDFNHPIANRDGFFADGYDIQIAKLIAGKLDMTLEVKKIAWNDLIPSLINGEIDVIFSSMLDTEERRARISFSQPYQARKIEYGIIVDSAGPYFSATSLSDFSGARITGEKGTNLYAVINQIPGVIHAAPRETVEATVNSVLKGEADGAVIDTDTGHFYEITNKNLTLVKFSGDVGFKLGFTGVCAGVRKDNTALMLKINRAISDIKLSQRQDIMDGASARMMTLSH